MTTPPQENLGSGVTCVTAVPATIRQNTKAAPARPSKQHHLSRQEYWNEKCTVIKTLMKIAGGSKTSALKLSAIRPMTAASIG
jgi:hypothetical protein